MSGSFREISFWRSSILRLISTSGYMNDAPQSTTTPTIARNAAEAVSTTTTSGTQSEHRHDAEELEDQHLVDVEVRRAAREHQLAPRLLAEARRREPPRDAGQPLEQRRDDALADRRQHLLVAHVLDLVALEPAERVAHLGTLGGHRAHDEHQGGDRRTPSTMAIINGVMSDLDRQDLAEPEEADDRS